MSLRALRWSSLVGGVLLIAFGVLLLIDDGQFLPSGVHRYWPVILIAWGLWKWIVRYRVKEDRWAGPDYGTGLYVIRRRRRPARGWLPGLFLIALGAVLLWTTLDPPSGFTLGPIVLVALGVFQIVRGFQPPPRTDFYGTL